MPRIFISYRREDSNNITGRIYDRLVNEFDKDNVFKDVDSIPLGSDFRHILTKAVGHCDVLLSVIGTRWVDSTDKVGRKRLSKKSDFVRVEIEAALTRGIPVIPVLVDGASVPSPEELPESLRDLSFRNGTLVRYDPDFHRDMDHLVDWLREYRPGRVKTRVKTEGSQTSSVRSCGIALLTFLLLISGLLGAWYWLTTFQAIAGKEGQKTDEPDQGAATPVPPQPRESEQSPTKAIGMKLTLVQAGWFRMGSVDAVLDEKPQHVVRITKPFYLGVYEVTQGEYQQVMGSNPSFFSSAGAGKDKVAGQDTSRWPVESISWLDAVAFCNKLSTRENLALYYRVDGQTVTIRGGNGYRLPTEAEWEYACRAGTLTKYSFGDETSRLGDFGWFVGNSGGHPHPVGTKSANAFGIYDMHGNICEWCWDYIDSGYYAKSPPNDARNDVVAPGRVTRGGNCFDSADFTRSAKRFAIEPLKRLSGLGFRVARDQFPSQPKLPVGDGFTPLFNGKNLVGWEPYPASSYNWYIVDGVIVGCPGARESYLLTERNDFKDVHVRVEARINDGGNSGVYVRAGWPETDRPSPWGYEAQINSASQVDPNRTGSIYLARRNASSKAVACVYQSESFRDGWFTLEVIAKGNRIVTMVNDKVVAEYVDEDQFSNVGRIALQLLGSQTKVEFRKVEIKELK